MTRRKTSSSEAEAASVAIGLSQNLKGLEDAALRLIESYQSGRQHHAIMLTGPKGIGKASLAYQFARFVFENPEPETKSAQAEALLQPIEGQMAHFVTERSHPDFLAISKEMTVSKGAQTSISIEDARLLTPFLGSKPALGRWRIVLIDGVEDMNRNAANALLKSLEEPPQNTLFLLICHAPGQLLPTIRSRCLMLPVKALAPETVAEVARQHLPEVDAEMVSEAARLSGGSVGRALALLSGSALRLNVDMLALLEQMPNISRASLSAFSEGFKGAEGRAAFMQFCENLKDFLSRLARGRKSALTRQESHIRDLLMPNGDLAPLSALWEKFVRIEQDTLTLNLDRKLAARNMLLEIEAESRKALADMRLSFASD